MGLEGSDWSAETRRDGEEERLERGLSHGEELWSEWRRGHDVVGGRVGGLDQGEDLAEVDPCHGVQVGRGGGRR
jgi:hypothetical protein